MSENFLFEKMIILLNYLVVRSRMQVLHLIGILFVHIF